MNKDVASADGLSAAGYGRRRLMSSCAWPVLLARLAAPVVASLGVTLGVTLGVALGSASPAAAQGVLIASNPYIVVAGQTLSSNGSGPTLEGDAAGAPWTVSNQGTIQNTYIGIGVQLSGGAITNAGRITSAGGYGVYGLNDLTLTNTGEVSGAAAVRVLGAGAISNSGSIVSKGSSSDSYGIFLGAGGTVTNNAGGTITGAFGIASTGAITLTNHGTITGSASGGAGIYTHGGVVSNADPAAIITGDTYGLVFARSAATGTVTNSGTISAGGIGVSVRSGGSVTNLGAASMISGTGVSGVQVYGGAGVLTNQGAITGAIGVDFTDPSGGVFNNTVVNSGTITGRGGVAIQFGGGDDLLKLLPGSSFSGVVDGAGGSNTLELAGAGASVGTIVGIGTRFTHFGTVKVDSGASWIASGTGTLDSGVTLTNAGSLTNTGTLGGAGALENAGALTNSGAITATTGPGVHQAAGGSIANLAAGSIQGSTYGVQLAAGGSVTNAGAITGAGAAGVVLGSASALTNQAGGWVTGVSGVLMSGAATVVNAGTIAGTGGVAVQFAAAGGALTLQTGSVMNGAVNGAGGPGQVTLTGTGTSGSAFSNFGPGAALTMSGTDWTLSGPVAFASTTVQTGALTINGALTGNSVSVLAGATLAGTGVITGAVSNSGNVAPGSAGAIGTLHVTGAYSQSSTGVLVTALNGAGQASLLSVTGPASLNGAVLLKPAGGGFVGGAVYTILTATGGITGAFAGGVTSASPLLTPALSYDAGAAYVTLGQLTVVQALAPGSSSGSTTAAAATTTAPPAVTSTTASATITATPTTAATSTAATTAPPASTATSSVASTAGAIPSSGIATLGATANQMSVAGAFDAGITAHASQFAPALAALDLYDAAGLRGALNRLSGQAHAGLAAPTLTAGAGFGQQILQQSLAGALGQGSLAADAGGRRVRLASLGAPVLPAESRWGAWATGYGQSGRVAGNDDSQGQTERSAGFVVGADYQLTSALRVGGALGSGSSYVSLDGNGGSANVDQTQGALYASYAPGRFYLSGLVGGAVGSGEMRRDVSLPNLPAVALSHVIDHQVMGMAESGYSMRLTRQLSLTPFVRLMVDQVSQDGVSETGGGALDLTVDGRTTRSARSTVGARFAGDWMVAGRFWTGQLWLGWMHEYDGLDRTVTAAFTANPLNSFQVQGAQPSRDGGVLGAALSTAVLANTTLSLRYDGELERSGGSQALSGGVRIIW